MIGRKGNGHGSRGAVLVETALTVGVILTILLFSVQAGVLGFLQLTFDAASFVDAHLAAVGVATPGAHAIATHVIFPEVQPAQIASTVAPAPTPSVPVNYGYNDPLAANQTASLTNRHGGASMMLPTQQISTVTKPAFFKIFGKSVGVASQSIDALWLECGIHVNVSNGNGACSPAATGIGSAAYQGSYFTAGENSPPYLVGLSHVHHCTDNQPWTTCSTAGTDFLAFGTAEFLHGQAGSQLGNWNNAGAGAGGTWAASTFSVMACHQRVFAALATALAVPQYATLASYYNYQNSWALTNSPYGALNISNAQAIYYQMYNIYAPFPTKNSAYSIGMNSFYLGPPGVSSWVIDFDLGTDQDIGAMYSWDTEVSGGTPLGTVGSNPTRPERWCS